MNRLQASTVDWPRIAGLVDQACGAADAKAEPGLAVAVSMHGECVWTHCIGLANVEHGVAINPDTRFRIASISKQMVAALVIMLADEGHLALDDKLHLHLPEMAAFDPPVTLRHLLTMSSGLHEVSHLGWLATGDQSSSRIAQDEWRHLMASQRAPGFAAGSRFLYNNANYMLLQWVAERVTGQPLGTLLQARLFQPLGMHDTLLPEHVTRLPARLATGYQKAAPGLFDAPLGWRNSGAAGGVMSTLADMARWVHALSDPVLLPARLPQRLREPFVFTNGQPSHYGLGLANGVHAGRPWFGHAGGLSGFSTDQVTWPVQQLSVTVLANRDDLKTMRLTRRIADHLIDGHSLLDRTFAQAPQVLPAALLRRCGVHASAEPPRVVDIAAGPGLLTANGLLLDAAGPTAMRVLIGDEPLRYEWQGDTALVETSSNGDNIALRRATPVPVPADLAAALEGSYGLPEIDARWRVVRKPDPEGEQLRLRIASAWRVADEFNLLLAAPDVLMLTTASGARMPASLLQLERDGTGAITALIGQFDRSRQLRLPRLAS